MADLKSINEAFARYVRPQTHPLAVRMCKSQEELPEKVRIPERDLGLNISICHALGMSRRYGWTMAVGKEQSCYAGGLAMGFLPLKPDVADGSFQESIGLMGKEAAAKMISGLNRFEYGKYQYVLMAPLDRAAFEPHLILFYGNPAQVWILLTGRLFGTTETLDTRLTTGAGCSTHITKAMLTGECQFVLVGTGERLIPHTQDDECAFSIPMSRIDKTIQGMEAAYKLGIARYPIPTFLRYSSQHPPGYDRMMAHLREKG